jgi:hypothetical protein
MLVGQWQAYSQDHTERGESARSGVAKNAFAPAPGVIGVGGYSNLFISAVEGPGVAVLELCFILQRSRRSPLLNFSINKDGELSYDRV